MDSATFDSVVATAVRELPQAVNDKLSNVAILIEDEPDAALREEEGLQEGETLLGLYRGIPLTERGSEYGIGGTLPDTITLFRIPILAAAEHDQQEGVFSEVGVARVVVETLWHEIGHYFGMDEPEIALREEAGTNTYRKNEESEQGI